ncbi:hypothetical protein [Salinibaculum rarum]|uniref:hypothetical protein n=1 Tax=Salinibaculum rarum TaxID=3058903 RepID=UPI00265E7FB4|nr:hypothetical protein [Salinibaculum sp. KK48]
MKSQMFKRVCRVVLTMVSSPPPDSEKDSRTENESHSLVSHLPIEAYNAPRFCAAKNCDRQIPFERDQEFVFMDDKPFCCATHIHQFLNEEKHRNYEPDTILVHLPHDSFAGDSTVPGFTNITDEDFLKHSVKDWTHAHVIADQLELVMTPDNTDDWERLKHEYEVSFEPKAVTSDTSQSETRTPGNIRSAEDILDVAGHPDDLTTITGRIMAFREPTGLVKQCDACDRFLQHNQCPEHGPRGNTGEDMLRIAATIHDGETSHKVVFDQELTEGLTGFSVEDAREIAAEHMDRGVVRDEFEDRLLQTHVEITGSQSDDEFHVADAALFTPNNANAVEVPTTLYACEDCNTVFADAETQQTRPPTCPHKNTREIGTVTLSD